MLFMNALHGDTRQKDPSSVISVVRGVAVGSSSKQT